MDPTTRAELRELRRRCEMRLRELELPTPFELESFCEVLARKRQRPIELHSIAGLGGRTQGAWIPTRTTDIIIYEQQTTPLHQDHIVLHELSHIICGHEPPLVAGDIAGALFPDLRADLVQGILERHAYATREEREAELMASLIFDRVQVNAEQAPEAVTADPSLIERLEAFRQGEQTT